MSVYKCFPGSFHIHWAYIALKANYQLAFKLITRVYHIPIKGKAVQRMNESMCAGLCDPISHVCNKRAGWEHEMLHVCLCVSTMLYVWVRPAFFTTFLSNSSSALNASITDTEPKLLQMTWCIVTTSWQRCGSMSTSVIQSSLPMTTSSIHLWAALCTVLFTHLASLQCLLP